MTAKGKRVAQRSASPWTETVNVKSTERAKSEKLRFTIRTFAANRCGESLGCVSKDENAESKKSLARPYSLMLTLCPQRYF